MAYSPSVHAYVMSRICALADEFCNGHVVAMGGGGYNLDNLARAWVASVDAMVEAERFTSRQRQPVSA
jgi:acetoin utilization protein AcuC